MEEWRQCPSEPGHEASSEGRIRNRKTGRIMKGGKCGSGYMGVGVAHTRHRYVSHLVAEAFIGPRPLNVDVNHVNGVKEDNRPANLEYCSHALNQRHNYRIIKHLRLNLPRGIGEGNTQAKLKSEQVLEIRLLLAQGEKQRPLAKRFGVSQGTISRIATGIQWSTA